MKDHGVAIEIKTHHLALLDQIRDRHAVNGDKVAQGLARNCRGAKVHRGDGFEALAITTLKPDAQSTVTARHCPHLHSGNACLLVDGKMHVVFQRQRGKLLVNARGRACAPHKARLDGNSSKIRGLELGMIVHVKAQIEIDRAVGTVLIGIAGALERQIAQHVLDLSDRHILICHAVLDKGQQDQIGIMVKSVIPCVLGQPLHVAGYAEGDLPVSRALGRKRQRVAGLHADRIRGGCRHGHKRAKHGRDEQHA